MAFHISRRKLKPKEEDEMGELNIVPYLDILMNLIIFMLLSMTGLATLGVLNVSAPAFGGGGGGAENPQAPELLLTVAISKDGFYVAGQGAVLPGSAENVKPGEGAPTVPKNPDGTYNYVGLNEKMKEVKNAVHEMIREGKVSPASDSKVIIAAEAEHPVRGDRQHDGRHARDRRPQAPVPRRHPGELLMASPTTTPNAQPNALSEEEVARMRFRKALARKRRKEREAEGEIKELNITAMMDMMTIILVFLIKSYSALVGDRHLVGRRAPAGLDDAS